MTYICKVSPINWTFVIVPVLDMLLTSHPFTSITTCRLSVQCVLISNLRRCLYFLLTE